MGRGRRGQSAHRPPGGAGGCRLPHDDRDGAPTVPDGGAAGGNATTGVGGGTFDLNAFPAASRHDNAGVNGQNTVAFNLEAGHIRNGHEALAHVRRRSSMARHPTISVTTLPLPAGSISGTLVVNSYIDLARSACPAAVGWIPSQ